MATYTDTISFDHSSDVAMRATVRKMRDMFVANGLVQTLDTGQFNLDTGVRRLVSNEGEGPVSGYQMFRFDDLLQSNYPIFIKIEYGLQMEYNSYYGGYIYTMPYLWVTVGTSTNGAGVLNGVVGNRIRLHGGDQGSFYNSSTNAGAVSIPTKATPVNICNLPGTFILTMGLQATAQASYPTYTSGFRNRTSAFPVMLVIERTHDQFGEPTGDGFIVLVQCWHSNNQGAPGGVISRHQAFSFASGGAFTVSPLDGYWPIACPGQGYSTANFEGNSYFYPLPVATPKPHPQSLAILGTFKNDVPLGSTQVVRVLGADHTYLSLAGIAGEADSDNARSRYWDAIPNGAVLMRWE